MYVCTGTKYYIFYLIIQYINSIHDLNSTKYLVCDSFTWEDVFMKSMEMSKGHSTYAGLVHTT